MTDPKPPVPRDECGIKCLPEPDGGGHHADCRYSVAEPPVPSDDALRRTYYGNCLARQFCDGLRDVWRDGYHARDAEVSAIKEAVDNNATVAVQYFGRIAELEAELDKQRGIVVLNELTIAELERDVASWRGDYEECSRQRAALEPRIAELEAEVTELRKQRDASEANYRLLVEAAEQNAKEEPRRTPELTERVARKLIYMYGATVSKPRAEHHMHNANAVLDLVFGKERKNAP